MLITIQWNSAQTLLKSINFAKREINSTIENSKNNSEFEFNCLKSCTCDFKNSTLSISCNEMKYTTNSTTSFKLGEVETFIVRNSRLQQFIDIYIFPNLKKLVLSGIKYINNDNLKGNHLKDLKNFEELTITKTKLVNISFSFINRINTLKRLSLTHNQIRHVDTTELITKKNLKSLDLSNNEIETIDNNLFLKLPSLETVDLSNNKLKSMELWPLYLPEIKIFDLRFNSIEQFQNELNWNLSMNTPELSDDVLINLGFNNFKDFKSIRQYGINNQTDLIEFVTKYLKAFTFNNNPIACDLNNTDPLFFNALKYLHDQSTIHNFENRKCQNQFDIVEPQCKSKIVYILFLTYNND